VGRLESGPAEVEGGEAVAAEDGQAAQLVAPQAQVLHRPQVRVFRAAAAAGPSSPLGRVSPLVRTRGRARGRSLDRVLDGLGPVDGGGFAMGRLPTFADSTALRY
jgi:hypothetical protein